VSAISGRGDLLATLFLLLAVFAHAGAPEPPGIRRRLVAAGLYGLALLSKESAAFGLVLFVLVDLFRMSTRTSIPADTLRVVRNQAGFLILCIAVTGLYFGVRQLVVAGDGSVSAMEFMAHPANQGAALAIQFVTCAKILFEYGRLLVWPLWLSADYGYDQIPLAGSFLDWRAGIALLVSAVMAAFAHRSYRAHPAWSFALLLLLAGVLPLAFVLPFFRIVLAERYLPGRLSARRCRPHRLKCPARNPPKSPREHRAHPRAGKRGDAPAQPRLAER